jgi:hypothetical protein
MDTQRMVPILFRRNELLKNAQLDPHIFPQVDDQTEIAWSIMIRHRL